MPATLFLFTNSTDNIVRRNWPNFVFAYTDLPGDTSAMWNHFWIDVLHLDTPEKTLCFFVLTFFALLAMPSLVLVLKRKVK